MIDLSRAVVVTPASLSRPEQKAVALLVEDVGAEQGFAWTSCIGGPARTRPRP